MVRKDCVKLLIKAAFSPPEFSCPLFLRFFILFFKPKMMQTAKIRMLGCCQVLTQQALSSFTGLKERNLIVMSLIWEKLSLCCHRRHSRLKTLFPQKVKQEKVGQIFSTCRRSQTVSGRRPFVSFHHLSSKNHLSWPLLFGSLSVFASLKTSVCRSLCLSFMSFGNHFQSLGVVSKIKHVKHAQQGKSFQTCLGFEQPRCQVSRC